MLLRAVVVGLGFVAAAFSGTPAPAGGVPAGLVYGGRPPLRLPAVAPTIVPSTANTITLTNQSGMTIANYPLQFGRPFLQGAITSAPQVVAGGTPLSTQADVKNRWPDGSVAYAVVAAVIPAIPAGGSLSLTFRNQTPNNTPLTQAQMLGAGFNFDAVLRVTGAGAAATAQSVSARTMLANGDCTAWTQGPVAQTMMCGDDSAARKYDIGFGDGYHPLRPRFYATFWPATHQVFVRVVAENDLASEVEDLAYTATISLGASAPAVAYSADLSGTQATNPKEHWAMTAWTQSFWLSPPAEPAPAQAGVNIDNNLAYLASTRFLPNYDMTIAPSAAGLTAEYAQWTGKPHDIYDGTWDGGVWQSTMSSAGARQEIAPYPEWSVLWLYTGDWRMRQMALGMADLAAAFPGNLRESATGKRLSRADPAGSSTGLGHTVSITDRPTLVTSLGELTYSYTKPADKVTIVGAYNANQPWSFDGAHQPSPFYPQYLVTGDPWYLQEMYLWAGFSTARYNGAAVSANDGRGPTGAEGGIDDELRGAGWVLRNRAETAFIAPDADPEKAYFTYLTNDALGRWEGSLGIAGTPYDGAAEKVWGAETGNSYAANQGPESGKPPPFGNWESNAYPNGKDATVTANVASDLFSVQGPTGAVPGAPAAGSFTEPWMQWYLQYALGRTAELGFAAGPLRADAGQYPAGMILDSGYPLLIGTYEIPVEANASTAAGTLAAPPGGFLSSWAAIEGAMTPAYLTGTGWPATGNGGAGDLAQYFAANLQDDGRPMWLAGGLAMMVDAGDPRAAAVWDWFVPNVYRAIPAADLAADPKWAIVPRTDTNVLPAQPTAVPSSTSGAAAVQPGAMPQAILVTREPS